MNFQIVGLTLGILLVILGLAEMVPAILDRLEGHPNAAAFFVSGVVSFFFGGSLIVANNTKAFTMTVRDAFLVTTLSWMIVSLFAALPFYLSDLKPDFADSIFESVSGITTTGSTVFVGLDQMSRGILLWRSIIQWIGGIGIIGFAIVLLPFLRVGGMQLFRTESSDRSEKVLPKTGDTLFLLLQVYILLTGFCCVVYKTFGMNWFEAVNHAMTTIATGGYSTHDSSFGFYDSYALHMAASFFMLLGSLPFILYVKILAQGKFDFFRDEQVRAFLLIIGCLITVMTGWLWWQADYSLADSFRHATFNLISVITTTGFATTDYMAWGPFAVGIFFFVTYIGGCAGSTSGGIKIMRLIIVIKGVIKQMKMLIYPRGIFNMYFQGRLIGGSLVANVLGFLCLYVFANTILTLALTWTGLDFATAVSGAATALANVGPGIGGIIGPAGNFATLPDAAKWLLSAGMILGRLEILTVAVLFSFQFWRH